MKKVIKKAAKKIVKKVKKVKCVECNDTKVGSPNGDACGHCKKK